MLLPCIPLLLVISRSHAKLRGWKGNRVLLARYGFDSVCPNAKGNGEKPEKDCRRFYWKIKSIEAFLQGGSWEKSPQRGPCSVLNENISWVISLGAGWGQHRPAGSHRPSCTASCSQGRGSTVGWGGSKGGCRTGETAAPKVELRSWSHRPMGFFPSFAWLAVETRNRLIWPAWERWILAPSSPGLRTAPGHRRRAEKHSKAFASSSA